MMLDLNDKKVPAVRIDPALDKCDNIVLFPDKLKKSNENLKKVWFSKIWL